MIVDCLFETVVKIRGMQYTKYIHAEEAEYTSLEHFAHITWSYVKHLFEQPWTQLEVHLCHSQLKLAHSMRYIMIIELQKLH